MCSHFIAYAQLPLDHYYSRFKTRNDQLSVSNVKESITQPTRYSILKCLYSDSWVVKWWLNLFTAQIMSQSMWLTQPSFPTLLFNAQTKKLLLPCIVIMHKVQKALQIAKHVKGQSIMGKTARAIMKNWGLKLKPSGKLITGWPFPWATAFQEFSLFCDHVNVKQTTIKAGRVIKLYEL